MSDRYALIQRVLHWLIAVMIVTLFIAGSVMSDIGFGRDVSAADAATRDFMYALHKSSGVALLTLVGLRILLRLLRRAPPTPPSLTPLQSLAASSVHFGLYGLMIATPVLGWLAVSSGGFLTLKPIFDAALPGLVAKGWMSSQLLFEWHEASATALVALAGLHAAAGVFHLWRGDGVFARMWFGADAN